MDVFYALAVLACPVGMGLMMWFMMRGGKSHDQSKPDATAASDAEVAALRAEIDQLRDGQRDRSGTQTTDPTETR